MERTEDGIKHFTLCGTVLWELRCDDIVARYLWMREQEVFDIVQSVFIVLTSRIALLNRLGYIQSGINAIALLSWPTESGKVDDTVKTILSATMAGLVLRLRL